MIRPADYESHPALSQSDLTLFEKNIVEFHKYKILGLPIEDKKSSALDLGSIVDALLLDPDSLKGYYIMTQLKATGKVKDVVDYVMAAQKDSPESSVAAELDHCVEYIKKGVLAHEYQANWKLETRIDKIKALGKDYYDQLLEAGGRVIIPMETWEKAQAIVNSMEEDEQIGSIVRLLKQGSDNPEECKIHKSVILRGTFEGEEIQGIIDFIVEFPREKVMWPWDLKTAQTLAKFLVNYRAFKYGRQGSFYDNLVMQNYPDYKRKPFSFLAVPTESGEDAERFDMSPEALYENAEGADTKAGYHINGWKELIRRVSWHKETGKWKHHKSYYDTGYNLITGNGEVDPALVETASTPIF